MEQNGYLQDIESEWACGCFKFLLMIAVATQGWLSWGGAAITFTPESTASCKSRSFNQPDGGKLL